MALTYRYGLRRSPCLILPSVRGAAVMMMSSSSIAAARCASGSSQFPAHSAMRRVTRSHSIITSHHHSNSSRAKGDYGFNVFHNSNPQHGGSYARHERRMREDEVDDFLKSVKGWTPVWETAEGETPAATGTEANGDASAAAAAPPPSRLKLGDEAITKTFTFHTFNDAYLFMGRLWAFCYGSDKYPHVVWQGCAVTVSLYSPSFKGLSKREARLAAFLNDQFNMLKKSAVQKAKVMGSALDTSTSSVEALVGEHVRRSMEEREQRRQKELQESLVGQKRWEELLTNPTHPPTP